MLRPTSRDDGLRLLFEELERRILLSADAAPGLLEPPLLAEFEAPAADHELLDDRPDAAAALTPRREVVFVDAGIADHEALRHEIETHGPAWLEVVVLEAGSDGIERIAETLGRHQELTGVHVYSHGSEDGLRLGSAWLGSDSLDGYAATLASWGDALAPGADLLLYGCNLAQGDAGLALLASLAELTGADVGASADATGSAALGGDWELEHRTGELETASLGAAEPAWSGLLASEPALWVSTAGDVTGSGSPDLAAWSGGAAVQIGPTDLGFGVGSSSGTLASEFDLDVFAGGETPGLSALHYVGRDLTLGGAGGFELREGDLILSTASSSKITLSSTSSLDVKSRDLFVFRPDTAGDYSSGSFLMLLEAPTPRDARSFTLVEQDTAFGDVTLRAGDLLFSSKAGNAQNQILLFRATGTSGGALQGTTQVLLDGSDAGLGSFDQQIEGLELLETETAIGNVRLPAGTLLLAFEEAASVGSNGVSVGPHDVVRLDVTRTTLGSGAGSGEATASAFLEGSGVHLDAPEEALDALAIVAVEVQAQTGPKLTLSSSPLDYRENDAATPIDASATLEAGPSPDFDGGTLVVDFLANGTPSDRLWIQAGGALGISGSDVLYDFGAGSVVIGSLSGGGDGATPLVVVFNADASPEAVEAVVRRVSYENVSENPASDARVVRFGVTDACGSSDTAIMPLRVTAVNDAPTHAVPGDQSVDADASLVFSAANGNTLSLADVDASSLEVTLTTWNGALTLSDTTGLVFSEGSGSGDTRMTFRGSTAAVNAALDGLRFDPEAGFDGDTSLSIVSNDLGQTGAGGAQGASSLVGIQVVAAPEPPPPPDPDPDPPADPPTDPDADAEPGDDAEEQGDPGDDDSGERPAPGPGAETLTTPPTRSPDASEPFPTPDAEGAELLSGPEVQEPEVPETGLVPPGVAEDPEEEDEEPRRPQPRFAPGLSSPLAEEALDAVRRELRDEAEQLEVEPTFAWTMARGVAVVFSTSLLGALARAGSLLAMTLSSLPIWLRFDPLAILALSDTERKRRKEELREAQQDEDASGREVGRLLDESDTGSA